MSIYVISLITQKDDKHGIQISGKHLCFKNAKASFNQLQPNFFFSIVGVFVTPPKPSWSKHKIFDISAEQFRFIFS